MKKEQPSLILIDGSFYLHRAYHAIPPMTNSKNQPTAAIYGVINMIRRLINEYHPAQIVAVFDAKGKTFRHELYKEYKAHRPPMPEDLQAQIAPLHEVIKAMGIPLLAIEGVEADDVLGTLAKHATAAKLDTIISTGDKDLTQLVNEHVKLINTMTNTTLDIKGVANKFGITPDLVIDYLTLVGDSSDNIPGVPKVGPKTAVKWLSEYGTLDSIIAHADEIKGKVGENLRNHLQQIPLTKKLVTICCDVDLNVSLDDLYKQEKNNERLVELFSQLEFKSWLAESRRGVSENKTGKEYKIILNEKDFSAWYEKLEKSLMFAVDTETTSLNYMQAQIVGISFAISQGEAIYIPLAHSYPGVPEQLEINATLKKLKRLLENPQIKKIGHNLKYDKEVLLNYGIDLQGIEYDTMLESYIFNSTASRHDLDSLALSCLNYNTIHYEDVAGKGVKQIPFSEVPLEQAGRYAAEDADISLQLHQYFWPKLKENKKFVRIFSDIEIPLLSILSKIERHGVLIDADFLKHQSNELAEQILKLEQRAFQLSDQVFNLDSPKQLQEILYQGMGLPVLKKTPKGQPSTAEEILQELALDFPIAKIILEYRSLSKLKSTYTDKLPQQINSQTRRVHTSYHQAITATGRLSSSDPNLQNIPIRNPAGRRIRQAFIAPENYSLLAADYSQIELRIMAHLSQDKRLLNAFAKGLDIHKATAAEVFAVDLNAVTEDQRRKAKAINFGLIYGMSAFGLAKQLGVERAAAQSYINAYFAQYPDVHEYMEKSRKFAHENEYVETLFGRRLYIAEVNSKNIQRQKAAERAAINGPLQGTAADIIKLAMIQVDQWLQESKLDIYMVMQVHDELVFEVPHDKLDIAKRKIQQLMSNVVELSIPIVVDIGVGKDWDKAH